MERRGDEHCDSCSTGTPIPTSSDWCVLVGGPGDTTPRRNRPRPGHRVEPGVRTRSQPAVGPARHPNPRASTRRELSTLTGLTFQTIENISRRLIDGGILEDLPPPAPTGRGRQLVLRPAGAYAIGIEASPEGCRLALCDLGGRTLAERRLSLCAPGDDSSVDELALMVQDLIDDAEVPITTVVAVGLTATGSILDAANGKGASTRGAPGPREWLRDGLERRLRMPVLCTSDVIAAARGEQWSGRIFSRDFVYVHLASEIGCAVISHGQLCTGARGRGGDIAHTPAVINGELCECGRRGCLQTVLAEQALRRSIATALSLAEPPTLDDISRRAVSDADAAEVIERVAIPPGRHAPASGSAARPRDRHDRWSCRGRARRSILQRSGTTRCRPRRR